MHAMSSLAHQPSWKRHPEMMLIQHFDCTCLALGVAEIPRSLCHAVCAVPRSTSSTRASASKTRTAPRRAWSRWWSRPSARRPHSSGPAARGVPPPASASGCTPRTPTSTSWRTTPSPRSSAPISVRHLSLFCRSAWIHLHALTLTSSLCKLWYS